jgi:hypothetical protein
MKLKLVVVDLELTRRQKLWVRLASLRPPRSLLAPQWLSLSASPAIHH